MNITKDKLISLIDEGLEQTGMSARRASLKASEREDLIRDIRRGRMPSFIRLSRLFKVLGIDVIINNPSKKNKGMPPEMVAIIRNEIEGEPMPPHLKKSIERSKRRNNNDNYLNQSPKYSENGTLEQVETYGYDPDIDDAEHLLVPKLELKLAAGHGSAAGDERPLGMLAFRRDWIRKHSIQPGTVSAFEIDGDSMIPYLNDGDTVLVRHDGDLKLKPGLVVAARVGDDLFVKRLQKMNKDWLLISDNHDYPPLALTRDDAVIGEIVWQGRWLK